MYPHCSLKATIIKLGSLLNYDGCLPILKTKLECNAQQLIVIIFFANYQAITQPNQFFSISALYIHRFIKLNGFENFNLFY